MGIEFIQEEKQYVYRDGNAEVFYRAVPKKVREAIQRRHTKRGVIDWIAIANDTVAYAIVGWKNVTDHGQAVAFAPELIDRLPQRVLAEIIELAADNPADAEEVQLGNSLPTPGSSSTTTD